MLLPGYALMALGTQIHVATWPFSWHLDPDLNQAPFMSQVFAAQGGCYVIATSALLRPEDVQEAYRELAISDIDEWIGAKKGGCRIFAPSGDLIAQATVDEETILTASVSLEAVLQAKAEIDVGGHYARPDVLQLHVNRCPLERVVVSEVSVKPVDSQFSDNNEHRVEVKDNGD
jgi:predicted amidohydrolase